MLTEMYGKAGARCGPSKEGRLRCPLNVRDTSEDVVTGHLVQALRSLNPRWWLSDLLNQAVGQHRFRRQLYRRFRMELWVNQPRCPSELLPWKEGSTQVDVEITWENPPTTVFVEAKYCSGLAADTVHSNSSRQQPADQLLRNIRVGLYRCGYYDTQCLFRQPPRDFAVVLLTPYGSHPLVKKYRSRHKLLTSIPHHERLLSLPRWPFLGQVTFDDIIHLLDRHSGTFSRSERMITETLCAYLRMKREHARSVDQASQQAWLAWKESAARPPHESR